MLVGLVDVSDRLGEGDARDRRDLASDAVDREEVGAVRFDLDVEDRIVQAERALQVVARRGTVVPQHEDPTVILRDRELAGRAEHPVRDHTSDLASAERLGQSRNAGPRWRERNEVSGRHVPHADDDLELAGARIHPSQAERGGIRVVTDLEHSGDDHPLQAGPRVEDLFDLHTLQRDAFGKLVGAEIGRRELAQPRQRDPHPTAPNCSSTRTSLSTSIRMSGISYLSRATRSTPMPKAKPVYRSAS